MISEKLRGLSADTGIVCLLLAVELGRASSIFSFDVFLIGLSLMVVAIVPFFLSVEEVSFGKWIASRFIIAAMGISAGAALSESVRFLPMSLLIVATLVSCAIQFYSLFKLRPAD